ncbi:hypothetical protein DFH08DRAFT_805383 [Mycena albidolilacea]|uniref:CxC2-like cysteine cluster KDZ transposase-associated domain-containing protein n=1 Tax=Mycena albidolilacea TaxID=1033008 RepID=A0AAD7A951_9AGAR|nr:hypothetical protein DFH08DRAFT_805383 [Mycena albidolilacea]
MKMAWWPHAQHAYVNLILSPHWHNETLEQWHPEQEEAHQKHIFSLIAWTEGRPVDIRVVPIQRKHAPVPLPPALEDEWVDMQVDDEPPADSRPPGKQKWTTVFNIGWQTIVTSTCTCLLLMRGSWVKNHPAPAFSRRATGAATALALRCSSAWNGTFFDRRDLRQLGLQWLPVALGATSLPQLDPATPDNPQSTITIAALKLFHAVSLQGKTTAYHFFNALAKITDNTGSNTFKYSRYQLALRVVRQWRNLCALKHGGMGNNPNCHMAEMRDGELAIDCLSFSKARVNLPEGFLYCIFFVIDVCFRLKRKKISSWLADPNIQDGWPYFTRSGPYMEFVETLGEQKEISTCTDLAALDHANTKYTQGYGNMGYIVASTWRHLCDFIFLLSYDIMCQWSKNLSNMEGIKRIGSSSRLMGASMCEMGPGSCQDTLDDFWHYWNWNKFVGMGKMLQTHLLKARKELARQEEGLKELTGVQEAEAPVWKQMVDDFETGVSKANLYLLPHTGPTLRDVELELMCEEQECERSTPVVLNTANNTATEYWILGLEIEGQQCILCARHQLAADLLTKRHPTSKELTDFVACHISSGTRGI